MIVFSNSSPFPFPDHLILRVILCRSYDVDLTVCVYVSLLELFVWYLVETIPIGFCPFFFVFGHTCIVIGTTGKDRIGQKSRENTEPPPPLSLRE